jgi:hypothetical protein
MPSRKDCTAATTSFRCGFLISSEAVVFIRCREESRSADETPLLIAGGGGNSVSHNMIHGSSSAAQAYNLPTHRFEARMQRA